MKILAAKGDVYLLTFFKKRYRKRVPFKEKRVRSRVRKQYLFYDPTKVVPKVKSCYNKDV